MGVVVQASGGEVQTTQTGQTVTWLIDLAAGEERTIVFYLRLPQAAGTMTLQTTVTANGQTVAQTSLDIAVGAVDALADLHAQVQQLANSTTAHRQTLTAAERNIDRAISATSLDRTVGHILDATDDLLGITDPAVVELRQRLDRWLRYTLMVMN